MAAVRISCFLVLCVFCVGAKNISGKGYYCRDPDTGKLHEVNTTWPSTTFCGNYVCKIRKRNHTNVEKQPLRQMNVTNRNNSLVITFNTSLNEKTPTDSKNILSQADMTADDSKESSVIPKFLQEKGKNLQKEKPNEGDRYLTNTEIKALTEILHGMKKSDLEALLEIYNIAQDIYKEMDKITDEDIIEETLKDLRESNNSNQGGQASKKSTSYWYEPLAVVSNKHRVGDIDLSKDAELVQNVLDILPPAKPKVVNEVKPKEIMVKLPPPPLPKPKPSKPVFAKGTVHEEYFEKLPYFFPISSFQRLSSYMNPTAQNAIQSEQKSYGNNAKPSPMYEVIPSWYKPYMIPFPTKSQAETAYTKTAEKKNSPPTPNLAYQIQSYRRNLTELENSYFNAYPWSLYPLYPSNKKPVPSQLPYVNTGYLGYLPNAVLINPELTEYKKGIDAKASTKQPEKAMPDWQTEPLSNDVLDEVRANIVMKTKLLPLRKKVRLERVGKVKKIEEISKRVKRETEDFDEYEAYVEKYTCNSDTEPGFFRMGNTSQPYPACCPQRIGKGS